jgi:hypothetical protein
VVDVLGMSCAGFGHERLLDLDASRYRPFILVLLEPGRSAETFVSDGRCISDTGCLPPPLTTSSLDSDVERDRVNLFALMCPMGEELPAAAVREYHQSHLPERGAGSVCMHRADAQTVSYSEIHVRPDKATFLYWDGPPCEMPRSAAPGVPCTDERLDVSELPLVGRGRDS